MAFIIVFPFHRVILSDNTSISFRSNQIMCANTFQFTCWLKVRCTRQWKLSICWWIKLQTLPSCIKENRALLKVNTCQKLKIVWNSLLCRRGILLELFLVGLYIPGVFSGSYFPVFGLKTEIYSVNLRIHSKYSKIRTRQNSVFWH